MVTALSVYLPFHLAAYCQHNCCPSLSHPIYLSSPLCSQSSMRHYHRTLLRLSCIVFTMFTSFIHGYKYDTPSYTTHLHSKGVLISITSCPRYLSILLRLFQYHARTRSLFPWYISWSRSSHPWNILELVWFCKGQGLNWRFYQTVINFRSFSFYNILISPLWLDNIS